MLRFADVELNAFDLSGMHSKLDDSWMPALKSLRVAKLVLSGCHRISSEGIAALSAPDAPCAMHSSLRVLEMNMLPNLASSGFENFDAFRNLEHLEITDSEKLTNLALAHIARAIPQLRSLCLDRCERISGAGIECLALLNELNALSLSGCARLTGESLRPLAALSTSLRHLRLQSCSKMNNSALDHISQLDALESLDLTAFRRIDDDGFERLAQCLHIKTLSLADTTISTPCVAKLLSSLQESLSSLNLTRCANVDGRALGSALRSCRKLRLRSLRLRATPGVGSEFLLALRSSTNIRPAIEVLDVSECRAVDDSAIFEMFHVPFGFAVDSDDESVRITDILPSYRFDALLQLNLKGTGVTGGGISMFASYAPALQELDVSSCPRVNRECIERIVDSCDGLTGLSLNGCSDLTNDSIQALAPVGKTLVKLNAEGCPRISNTGMRALARSAPNLTALSVAFTSVSDAGIVFLGGLKHLRVLSLKGLVGVTAHGLRSLASGGSRLELENLNLSGCRNVCDRACAALEQLSSLSRLSLHDCVDVSEAGVRKLVSSLARLESLNLRGCSRIRESVLCELLRTHALRVLGCDHAVTGAVRELKDARKYHSGGAAGPSNPNGGSRRSPPARSPLLNGRESSELEEALLQHQLMLDELRPPRASPTHSASLSSSPALAAHDGALFSRSSSSFSSSSSSSRRRRRRRCQSAAAPIHLPASPL